MTAQTLHQIADLLEQIGRLEARIATEDIGPAEILRELGRIRSELYRLAIESRTERG